MTRFSWTQPACVDCWNERNPGRWPTRMVECEPEVCVYCGQQTVSGIYVRVDPASVPHPTLRKD